MRITLKKSAIFTVLSTLAVMGGLVGWQGTAAAQQKTGLSVSPPSFELKANPGETVKNSIRVENVTDEPLSVSVDKRSFSALGEEGQVSLSDEDNSYSLRQWIEVTPNTATIAPKESTTFEYSVTVPQNAEPGSRFGSIVFKTTPKPVSGGTGVNVGQEVGSLLFLRIAGDVKEKGDIESFTTSTKLYQNGPVKFEARVKNSGNVHFRPTGTITIANMFGKTVKTIPVDTRNVLPDAVRRMEGEWKQRWVFGPHTATISLNYGSNNQIMTASTSFWGFPWKIALIVLVVAVLLIVWLVRGRKRLKKSLKVLFGKD